jgi:hypothetical protein
MPRTGLMPTSFDLMTPENSILLSYRWVQSAALVVDMRGYEPLAAQDRAGS